MKVFVTGASGFIGSAVVKKLLEEGHEVLGLARSKEAASKISALGANVLEGNLEDLGSLEKGVALSDGVIHTGFIHDFSKFEKSVQTDKEAILCIGNALKGTKKPLVVAAGILGLPKIEGIITEESVLEHSFRQSEAVALQLAKEGVKASVVRLPPSVHDKGDKGFIPFIIQQAIDHGYAAYPDEGQNHWPAVHRLDAASVFVKALLAAQQGALYNAIGDSGIRTQEIAKEIGEQLQVPVQSVQGEQLQAYFKWMSSFITFDSPASASRTKEVLNWKPKHIGLLEDMTKHYF